MCITMKINKIRDLTLVTLPSNQMLVIACDSCGGIGNKVRDVVKTSPDIVGYFTTRVALMEVLATGAELVTVVNNLSVEFNNTGNEILKGVKRAVESISLDQDMIITGSTEENFPTVQTGIGITAIGIIDKNKWEKPRTNKGALAVIAGLPKVGTEVLEDQGEIFTLELLLKLMSNPKVQEILPVGSKGILYELEEMSKTNGLKTKLDKSINIDLYKSAGPATCAIIAIDEDYYDEMREKCPIPLNKIGRFL